MKKTCFDCKREKPASEFYRKGDGLHSKCKKCFNSYTTKRWIERKKVAIENKGGKCEDCGGIFHYAVFEFHHLYGKDFGWEKLRKRAWTDIHRELSKCVLLCANCHRLRHALQEGRPHCGG